jgi:nitrous oxide reductase accessory protein NosL
MAKTYQADAFASSWVFFIDDAPQANWEHPCRYAFIDESTGKYMVVEAGSPPDDMNLFMKLHPQP